MSEHRFTFDAREAEALAHLVGLQLEPWQINVLRQIETAETLEAFAALVKPLT